MLARNNEDISKSSHTRYRLLENSADKFANASEVAEYIAQLSGEMAAMSRSARLDVIAYFLEMVREEARKTARRKHPPMAGQLTAHDQVIQK
ncbi:MULTISPECIES: hypothetical protein [unclassified Chelatococcus]|uniref:hypothetical protein n=1 Tax=unclassified Chelatococcus TaxID=2638111 RepID=UPI001BCDE521|nr:MULTISPECIES: hypothetical protein [unclassified Chelatococcus]CAH1669716.1 conserved hypothetical protein [Hyphomicrobiales bacterium]MBS7738242.1 hypothetical protein [Chelatococcus sp. HY11]MBX3545770.1 hypothetical protein [Chelatococcus sp.]MCO5077412.1 hypothetical protein [Chelatococcus sp.]CAH1678064.1 conserved hypothetical protein [Hyphomicrobiales bacterium]